LTAREVARTVLGLPEYLRIPTAAVDESVMATYIGDVESILSRGTPNKALLVRVKDPPPLEV
jgi:hypothetical protein